jgi:GntR family transcriptional regulator
LSSQPYDRICRLRCILPVLSGVSGRPLYLQLADQQRADAASRKPGEQIESEPQLARRFGVSRFTVTRAVEILVKEGLFTRRQGLGTFVAPPRLKRSPGYLASFTEAVLAEGRTTSHLLLNYGPMEARSCVPLPYPDGTRLLRLGRLRFVDGAPTAIHHSVLDAAVVETIGLTESIATDPQFSLYALFRKAGFAIERAVETLHARRAAPDEAHILELDEDRVVMDVRRETYASDGTLLDVDDAIYDARRYAFESDLRRSGWPPALNMSAPTETAHASNSNDKRSFGPRIGPRNGGGLRG